MKKSILPALAAAVFGVSLMAAAVDTGDTKGAKKDCPAGCCGGKECKDMKAKGAKAEAPKPEAPKA